MANSMELEDIYNLLTTYLVLLFLEYEEAKYLGCWTHKIWMGY